MYDAIIVGARCAGSATGMLLARQGHSVLVVDRAEFPSDTWSTHFIQPAGTALLSRWGAIDPLKALGVPFFDTIIVHSDDLEISSKDLFGPAENCSPRRTDLDLALSELARASGAEIRLGVTVTDVVRDADARPQGVRLRDANGNTSEERARIVVGADGRTSVVAKEVQPATRDEHEMQGAALFAYFDGLEAPVEESGLFEGTFQFIFPTKAHSACVGGAINVKFEDEIRADPDAAFERIMANVPAWAERMKTAVRDGRWRLGELREGWFRHAAGAGWALVGDSVCLKDPFAGHGITDAFIGAELLSSAVHEALTAGGSPEDFDAALVRYDEALWRHLRVIYEKTRDAATYDLPGSDLLAKMAEIAGFMG